MVKNNIDGDLQKALESLLSPSELASLLKGETVKDIAENEGKKEEDDDEENKDDKEIEREKEWKAKKADLKKAKEVYKAKKKESGINELKKSFKMKAKELKKSFPDKFEKKKDEELNEEKEVKKSSNVDIMKAFSNALDLKLNDIKASNSTLLEKIDLLKSENAELKTAVAEIGGQRLGMKSATHHKFMEKSEQNDLGQEGGKTVLSLSQHKSQVETVLDAAMEKATNSTIKKALGDQLMNYNSGNAPISQEIASYLYSTENIKLVQ